MTNDAKNPIDQPTWHLKIELGGLCAFVNNVDETRACAVLRDGLFPHDTGQRGSLPEHFAALSVTADHFVRTTLDPNDVIGLGTHFEGNVRSEKLVLLENVDVSTPNDRGTNLTITPPTRIPEMRKVLGSADVSIADHCIEANPDKELVRARVDISHGTLKEGDKMGSIDTAQFMPLRRRRYPYVMEHGLAASVIWTVPVYGDEAEITLTPFGADEPRGAIYVTRPADDAPAPVRIVNSMWAEIVRRPMDFHPSHFKSFYGLARPPVTGELPIPIPHGAHLHASGGTPCMTSVWFPPVDLVGSRSTDSTSTSE